MSTMDKRLERLEHEAAARKPSERRVIQLIAQEDETTEQALTRWNAEHPEEPAADEKCDIIILRMIVSPNSKGVQI
jgi:hypothetical protein